MSLSIEYMAINIAHIASFSLFYILIGQEELTFWNYSLLRLAIDLVIVESDSINKDTH